VTVSGKLSVAKTSFDLLFVFPAVQFWKHFMTHQNEIDCRTECKNIGLLCIVGNYAGAVILATLPILPVK
jgi:hypothetical protein